MLLVTEELGKYIHIGTSVIELLSSQKIQSSTKKFE